jgi:ABC-type multidrug transport system ATPase subunit
MPEVSLENISKSYLEGKVKAVKEVSFSVEKGELFGLIGPDGAGKTSLFRILTTLLLPDSGTASVFGCDIVKDFKNIRKHVGYMPGKFSLYQDLTVEENLNFFATVFGTTIQENYDLIKDIYVQLEPFKNRRAGNLSGGMKQKLALCCALIHRPKVLFLDEPTTGVDTVSRKEFWEMLKRLKEQGITILVSTPYMDEATLCERIALIQEGEIMSINTPQGIIAEYPKELFSIKSSNMIQLLDDLRKNDSIDSCNAFGEYHHITFKSENTELAKSELESNFKRNQDHKDLIINTINPTIEDCFINLMN